jgi:hypothetical protein
LIKNGKYFVSPQRTDENFKQLFARLASAGAGKPVDEQGFPDGPWTAEALTDEISTIEANQNGIELRAVQTWFQDNDSGISTENIRWLARIFGCEDPAATSHWQVELTGARDRLTAQRRAKRSAEIAAPRRPAQTQPLLCEGNDLAEVINQEPIVGNPGQSLASRVDAAFSGASALTLPITVWGGLALLWLLTFAIGTHDVTYSPVVGVEKQVGFVWSPAWNIGDLILLPILLMIVSGLLGAWKTDLRPELIRLRGAREALSWQGQVRSFNLSFRAILLVCFLLVFLVQWVGVYLLPLIGEGAEVRMIDWALVALADPDTLSVDAAIFVSLVAFLFSGLIYFLFFAALLLIYIICCDYAELCEAYGPKNSATFNRYAVACGITLLDTIFRCAVLGILIALCMKLNSAYLVTDAEGIISWLTSDAMIAFGLQNDEWEWISGNPSPFLTSFLLLLLLCFLPVVCIIRIRPTLTKFAENPEEERRVRRTLIQMICAIAMLATAHIAVGQFFGFSIFLGLSVVISLLGLLGGRNPKA